MSLNAVKRPAIMLLKNARETMINMSKNGESVKEEGCVRNAKKRARDIIYIHRLIYKYINI